MIFERPDQGRLKFTHRAITAWESHVQNERSKHEAGGILLGRRIEDSFDVIVDRVTEPTVKDRRSRFKFFRSKEPHQRVIDSVWEQSDGACNYLGEWHTHPQAVPTPSCIDHHDWRRLLKECEFDGEELFFVIVGTETLGVWEGRKDSRKFKQLKLIE